MESGRKINIGHRIYLRFFLGFPIDVQKRKRGLSMKNHLKPMGIRDILDSTFTILRENFWSFPMVFVKSFLPAFLVLLSGAVAAVIYLMILSFKTHIPIGNSMFWSEVGHSSMLAIVLGIILLILVIIAFIVSTCIGGIYFTYGNFLIFKNGLHGQKTLIKEVFQGIRGNRGRIFLVQFIVGLLLYVVALPGFIVSLMASIHGWFLGSEIIPYINWLLQILVGFFFCMALPVVVFEKVDVLGSIGRGLKLMTGHRWRVFWSLVLVYLLAGLIYCMGLGILAIPIVFAILMKDIIAYIIVGIFILGGLFVSIYLGSYFYGPLTAIYYDLIIRKEGYDIQLQLTEVGEKASSESV